MTKQQELDCYKRALIDFKKGFNPSTRSGLCHYFAELSLFDEDFDFLFEEIYLLDKPKAEIFPTLAELRTQPSSSDNAYWFYGTAISSKGKMQRIVALHEAIEKLEKELKNENHD